MARVLRTTLPAGKGGVVHLFVVYGYQGAEEGAEKLQLTDRLLRAVLARAQAVCVGQPVLLAGDLNADPAVISCLAKGISAGRYVDLALANSLGAGLTLDATCRFSREEGTGSRRISLLAVPMLLLLLRLAMSLIGGSLLTFQFLLAFELVPGWLTLRALLYASLFGLFVGWILLIGPPRRLLVLSRMSGTLTGTNLGWFLRRLFLLLGVLSLGLLLMIFGPSGVGMLRRVYFGPILKLEVPLKLAALAFLAEVCYVFVAGVWEAELLAARVPAGCIGLAMVMRLMCIALSTLLILLFLLYCSFVGVLSPKRMFSKVSGVKGVLSLGGMLFHPWDNWFFPDLHGFYKWVFDSLEVLSGFLKKVVVFVGMLGSVSGFGEI